MRECLSMDKGWKFYAGDFTEPRNRWAWGKSGSWNQGPESMDYDDSAWRNIDVPHDFVIEGKPEPYLVDELSCKDNVIPAMQSVNNMHTTAGSFTKGVGWYRKHFHIAGEDLGKKIYFIFDGIYRDSSIFLNNFFIRKHLSGYTGICCDITDFVNYGGDNVISVRADAGQPEGWFYEGGGIYRHTCLLKTEAIHIDNIFVTSTVRTEERSATLQIITELENTGLLCAGNAAQGEGPREQLRLCTDITGPDGISRARLVTDLEGSSRHGRKATIRQEAQLDHILLWDIDAPHLYRAECSLYLDDTLLDRYSTSFGIRDIRFDGDTGFYLNGHNVKLKGVCCHQNHGGLGTALPDEIYAYRIKKLKEMGCNAYRTSHYPPSPRLLDICDRLGMLVMDETRLLSSAEEDLAQLEFMVKRDRNHPSVILYSIGNEEAQSQTTKQGTRIAATMREHIKALDHTRPVTMGLLLWDLANRRPIENLSDITGISEKLDVAGFNYHEYRWEEFHSRYPSQPMVCTEQGTFKSTRGCYTTDAAKCHLAITDKTGDSYMKGAGLWHTARSPYMSGLFLWTGFDYYGEPTPYAWPAIGSQFGIMDLCGYPKDSYYYYKAWWTDETVLHLFPHWNGTPGERKDIHVFSNCHEVELLVNGRSLGRKSMETDSYLEWENIPFEPGVLTARGYDTGNTLVREENVRTTGAPFRAVTGIDYLENDIAVMKVEIQDADGLIVPDACNGLTFKITGNGTLLGASNGDPSDHTPVHSYKRKAFNGLAQAILKFYGEITVTAQAEGLECNTVCLS